MATLIVQVPVLERKRFKNREVNAWHFWKQPFTNEGTPATEGDTIKFYFGRCPIATATIERVVASAVGENDALWVVVWKPEIFEKINHAKNKEKSNAKDREGQGNCIS